MRVRKSVPEGYKTKAKKTITADLKQAAYVSSNIAHSEVSSEISTASVAYTELIPYCGILKTGGLSSQLAPAEEDLPPLQFADDEWSLSIPSSQESSGYSMPVTPIATSGLLRNQRKRPREDADDEDLRPEMQPVSPRSRPISHTKMPNLDDIRPIALPKTRTKVSMKALDSGGSKESEMLDANDFGDAPFLKLDDCARGSL